MAAMQALISAGIEFDCFEATERVGGHWHTDYDCLHLITPREGSGFRGDPMPQSWADFPRRSQMLDYLERLADRNHLRDRVTFGTRVDRLDPIGANAIGGWNVSTSDGRTRTYAGILVANGHNSVPFIPTVAGEFTGKMLHSGEYSNPTDIEGRRVLVVGLCAPRGPQLPVYSDQSAVIVDMLELQERMQTPLADTFSATDEPEGRIDIVRSIWNDQMAATRKRLGELARLSPPAAGPAAAGPAAAGPSKSAPFAAQR